MATYLHTVRVLGNIVAHAVNDAQPDVPVALPMILTVVEWDLLDYSPPAAERTV